MGLGVPKKGFLRKAFASAVLVVAATTGVGMAMASPVSAAPVRTGPVATSVSNIQIQESGTVAAVPGAIQAPAVLAKGSGGERARERAQERAEAITEAMASGTDSSIMQLVDKGHMSEKKIPYFHDSLAEMDLPAGTQASDITPEQRTQFLKILDGRQNVAIFSASNVQAALDLGLSTHHEAYFDQCRADLAITSDITVTRQVAEEGVKCLDNLQWEQSTKPAVIAGVGVAAAVATTAAAAVAVAALKKRNSALTP